MKTEVTSLSNPIINGDFVITWNTKTGAVSVWNKSFEKALAFFRKLLYMQVKARLFVFPADGSPMKLLGGEA